eukprot:sb/3466165/
MDGSSGHLYTTQEVHNLQKQLQEHAEKFEKLKQLQDNDVMFVSDTLIPTEPAEMRQHILGPSPAIDDTILETVDSQDQCLFERSEGTNIPSEQELDDLDRTRCDEEEEEEETLQEGITTRREDKVEDGEVRHQDEPTTITETQPEVEPYETVEKQQEDIQPISPPRRKEEEVGCVVGSLLPPPVAVETLLHPNPVEAELPPLRVATESPLVASDEPPPSVTAKIHPVENVQHRNQAEKSDKQGESSRTLQQYESTPQQQHGESSRQQPIEETHDTTGPAGSIEPSSVIAPPPTTLPMRKGRMPKQIGKIEGGPRPSIPPGFRPPSNIPPTQVNILLSPFTLIVSGRGAQNTV